MCAVYTQALVKAQIYIEDHKSSPPHCLLQGHLEGPEFVVSLQHKHDGHFFFLNFASFTDDDDRYVSFW